MLTLVWWALEKLALTQFQIPRVELDVPVQKAEEADFVWWHVPVWITSPWFWQLNRIEGCKARLLIESPFSERKLLGLLWSSLTGPTEYMTLRYGETQYVPVLVRSERECVLSGDPVRLPPFALPAKVTRISDQNALIHRTDFSDLQAMTDYLIRMEIVVGNDILAGKAYDVHVPGRDENNSQLIFTEAS